MNPKKFRGWCSNGCGKRVKRHRHRFCSQKCLGESRTKVRPQCLSACGKRVSGSPRKYCSYECQQEYQFRVRVAALEAGVYRTQNCNGFLRRYLVSKLGERCSKCGWDARHPRTNRVPVEVEHIDGNWENNRPENLTLLCPNCHALTSTFRGLNRGKGRQYRLGSRANPKSDG